MPKSIIKKIIIVCVAAAVLSFGGAAAQAAVYNVSALDGSQAGFGYDHDQPAPQVTGSGFYASGTAAQYSAVEITPAAIGLSGLTLGDITSIAYDTKQISGNTDWYAIAYTVAQSGTISGGSSWYGVRLKFGLNTGTVHDWATTSRDFTSASDSIKNGTTPGYTSTEYTIGGSSTQYNALLTSASSQTVAYIAFYVGASTGTPAFNSYLDNIQINTSKGNSTINAVPAPVPEPSALFLLGVGGFFLLGYGRRVRRAKICEVGLR